MSTCKVIDCLSNTRPLAAALFAASLGILVFVYISQYVFHFDPCPLCLWQRKPYFVVLALSLFAFMLADKKSCWARWALAGCGLAFMTGVGISGFHSGVEMGWWKGLQACGDASLPDSGDIEALRNYLLNRKIVRCDVPIWQFLGLSMTMYNFIASSVLAAVTFFLLYKGCKKSCAN